MSERYKPLFALKPYSFSLGVPVILYAGKLYWDNNSNRPCILLKLQSCSSKVIQSVSVQIQSKNYTGEALETEIHTYSQLNVARDQFFGDQEMIALNDSSAATFSARIIEAVLYDGTVIVPDDDEIRRLPDLQPLKNFLEEDAELEKQFQKENGKNQKYSPALVGDAWRCSCGAVNNETEQFCHICRTPIDRVLYPDIASLKQRRDIRVAAEAKEKQRIAKQMKQYSIIGVALIVALVIIILLFKLIINPASRYKDAAECIKEGFYLEAYELYTANGSYKDSEALAAECALQYAAEQYEIILTQGFYDDTYGEEASDQDMKSTGTVFSLAYIDDDNIPELMVAPYGSYGYVFSIDKVGNSLTEPYLVNPYLTLNVGDSYEAGYYEYEGFVYDKHYQNGANGYINETWSALDEEEDVCRYTYFYAYNDFDSFFGNNSGYQSNDSDGNEEYYDEEGFYNTLSECVDQGSYKKFQIYSNTSDNRNAHLFK